MLDLLSHEWKKTLRNPARLKEALRPRRWRQLFRAILFSLRSGHRWQAASTGPAFQRRAYSRYEDYVKHQQSKLADLDLSDYEIEYRRKLSERLAQSGRVRRGMNALCLGARLGAEVRAFQDHGCFAVGLDLNPGPRNPFVLHGDFHAPQFPAESVDAVFTNSLDHVFDMEKFVGEVRRVLKPKGLLILETIQGRDEGSQPDLYASFSWTRIDDVVGLFERSGFHLVSRSSFADRWSGEQLCFERTG